MELSNSKLNKIGDVIRSNRKSPEYDEALSILNDWREAHGPILDKYYDKCVKLSKKIDKNNIIVAQRLKRLPTIISKLNRFKTMRLASMQDIAGVRIIVSDMEQLTLIEKRLRRWKNLHDVDDYITHPKNSGYRGKHFIFKENDMFVEIQLRTQLQHLWATSVETTDIFRGTSLKEKDDTTCWHDFFCQVSSIFAIAEKSPGIPPYRNMDIKSICNMLQENAMKNQIITQIASFALVKPVVDSEKIKEAYYFVITLDFKEKEARIISYKEQDYHASFKEYQRLEQENSIYRQTVLIALNQIEKTREAYPNYFMDLTAFLDIISYTVEKNKKSR